MNRTNRNYGRFGWILSLVVVALLALAGCGVAGGSGSDGAADNQVTGIVWEWTTLDDRSTGEEMTVSDPASYRLILHDDGTFNGTADCNQIAGSYTTENNGYQFTMGPSTMALCGEESLDQLYVQTLSAVVAGGPDGAGGFALETAGGAQRMEFRNGGEA